MTERRDRIPGVSVETERSLSVMLRRIESRLLALEGRSVRRATVVGNASALPGETLIVDAPPSGLRISLPQPTQALLGSVVRLVMRTAHDVTIASSLGRVNGGASVVIGRVGTVTATCDGVTGWMLSIDEAALAADLASDSVVFDSASGQLERAALTGEVTASQDSNATSIVRSTDFAWTGDHSFAAPVTVASGQHVAFGGGGLANGDVRGASGLALSAGTGALSAASTGDATIVSAAGGVAIGAGHSVNPDAGDVAINAASGVAITADATTPVHNPSLGDVRIQAASAVLLRTGGAERVRIDVDGALLLASDPGDAGQVLTSAGASSPAVWQDPPGLLPADQFTIASPSGNLGTIDLGDLRCGGYVVITPVSANWEIEGWTCDNHVAGFWFHLFVTSAAFTGVLRSEDASASGNNRMRCRGGSDVSGEAIQATIYCISTTGSTRRWSVVA